MKTEGCSKHRPHLAVTIALGMLLLLAMVSLTSLAHTPILYLEDNEDGTIYVEGGFSDGSSAAGSGLRLEDKDGNSLWEGELSEYSYVESIPIPEVRPYYVVFDAGPGHVVTKEGLYPDSETAEEPEPSPAPTTTAPSPSASNPATTTEAAVPTVVAPTSTGIPAWSPAATLPSAWAPSSGSAGASAPDYTAPLWVIAALLAVIAVLLLVAVCGLYLSIGFRSATHSRSPQGE